MSGRRTGRAWWKTRSGNDLDDYLAEVDEHLFCVHRDDRECLLRDLKAHVRELTSDPSQADRFGGTYAINREQLIDEVGEPKQVARDYITCAKIVPGLSMRIYYALLLGIFLLIIMFAANRIIDGLSHSKFSWEFIPMSIAIIIGAIFCIIMMFQSGRNIGKYYIYIPSFAIILAFISYPFALNITWTLFKNSTELINPDIITYYFSTILFYFILFSLFGLYISMKHVHVIASTRQSDV